MKVKGRVESRYPSNGVAISCEGERPPIGAKVEIAWDELRPCPFCKSHQVEIWSTLTYHYGICLGCEARGPFAATREEAVRKWNARQT